MYVPIYNNSSYVISPRESNNANLCIMSKSPYLIKAQESSLSNFPGGRVIGQAFKTDLMNLHRMMAPQGFVILELDKLCN